MIVVAEHLKARVVMLALRRGFGIFRAYRAAYVADARGIPREQNDSIIFVVDRHGVQRELCRNVIPHEAWKRALEILEAMPQSPARGDAP